MLKLLAGLSFAATLLLSGCKSPMEQKADDEIRDSVVASNKAYLAAIKEGTNVHTEREISPTITNLTPARREELDRIAGPRSHQNDNLDLGPDLLGKDTPTVSMTLQRAIQLAVEHNLEVQQARLLPAISESQITQALGAFDPIAYVNLDYQNLDTPKPATLANLAAFGTNLTRTTALTTGIRQTIATGAEVKAQTEIDRNYANPSFFSTSASQPAIGYQSVNVLVGITQPLLRGFGEDVTMAQVTLARSARGQSVQDLRKQTLETVYNTEKAYWDLAFTRMRLLIQLRLMGWTAKDQEKLQTRQVFDTSPLRLYEASSFLANRRTEVIRAAADIRQASDALKRLINSPDLPLSDETQVLPLDEPADMKITYSLFDAVSTAMRRRPELQRAILEIHDASTRLMLADNARLPKLDLTAAIRYNAVGKNVDEAYGNMLDANYIDYLVGAQFEMPLGNTAAEGLYTQRQVERRALTMSYRRTAQDVLLDVKKALRDVLSNYEQVGSLREARLFTSNQLRAIEEQEKAAALTPEFLLDFKLNTQQRLADAETQEFKALTDYNSAIAKLYQSMGTLLDRNNIEFEDKRLEDEPAK